MVAVTVHVPATAGAVSVVPDTVQLPDATAKVTAPLPLPPAELNVAVCVAIIVDGDTTADKAA